MSTYSILSNTNSRFAKIAALAMLSAAVALTSGCATKRATSEVVVAPLGIPSAQVGYTGAIILDNPAVIVDAAENLEAVVFFGFDSSEITPQAASILNQHANLLNSGSNAGILIAGHTDELGSREYNIALGERRAQAASAYLVAQGVPANNIQVISYGEERPAVVGTTQEIYALNRRAVLTY